MQPSIEGLPEMGWLLAAHAHGQGYAAEGVAADSLGNVYGAEVGPKDVKKYVRK